MVRKICVFYCIILSTAVLIPFSSPLAASGEELFVKLTCFSCHGQHGKGMFRTKDKARYRLRKKVLAKLKEEGLPAGILKKLKTLSKEKFKQEKKFVKALEETIGKNNTARYQTLIIKYAGKVSYRKGDPIAGFEAYPKLAGNKEIYLFQQMKNILEKKRVNGNTESMRGILPFLESNKVTDDDLKAIAKYLSQVK